MARVTSDSSLSSCPRTFAGLRGKLAWTFAVLSVMALLADTLGPIRAWPKLAFLTAFAAYNVLDPTATFGRRWFWLLVWLVWAGFVIFAMATCCDHCCALW